VIIETLIGTSAFYADCEDGADRGGLAHFGLAFRTWFRIEQHGDAVLIALVEDSVSSRNALA
jgi:hypothetical protein